MSHSQETERAAEAKSRTYYVYANYGYEDVRELHSGVCRSEAALVFSDEVQLADTSYFVIELATFAPDGEYVALERWDSPDVYFQ